MRGCEFHAKTPGKESGKDLGREKKKPYLQARTKNNINSVDP